jgi:hypothetical protein
MLAQERGIGLIPAQLDQLPGGGRRLLATRSQWNDGEEEKDQRAPAGRPLSAA